MFRKVASGDLKWFPENNGEACAFCGNIECRCPELYWGGRTPESVKAGTPYDPDAGYPYGYPTQG